MQLDRDHHAVLQEGGAVADEILLQLELLVGLGVHEHQRLALLVEEGEILLLEPDFFDRLGRAETLVELGAVDQVLQLDLIIGAALAGLDMVALDRRPEAALMLDDIARTDFVAVDFHVCSFGVFGRALACGKRISRLMTTKPGKRQACRGIL